MVRRRTSAEARRTSPTLHGEHLVLRPSGRGDLELFLRWFNDAETTHFLLPRAPIGRDAEERWVAHARAEQGRTAFHFVICRAEDGLPIGTVSLFDIDRERRSAGFGIAIGEKAFWGRGHGTDATRTIVDFSFGELGLERIWLHVFAYNARGLRTYEKAGFRVEVVARHAHFHRGAWHDEVQMAILRPEWEALRAGREK